MVTWVQCKERDVIFLMVHATKIGFWNEGGLKICFANFEKFLFKVKI